MRKYIKIGQTAVIKYRAWPDKCTDQLHFTRDWLFFTLSSNPLITLFPCTTSVLPTARSRLILEWWVGDVALSFHIN